MRPATSLEAMIGGRGLPVAGAIAFILGVGFLVTLAVRDGWFGRLPALAKCGAGAVLGIGLLVAAAIVARRVNRWAASGLNAAGLGALYVSAWAAWALYGLVGAPAAFGLLGVCAGLGLVIAARSKFVEVAIVALIGAYLAPLLVGQRDADPMVLPVYLLSLLVVGLGLSWRVGGTFGALRSLTLAATMVMGSFWALNGVPSSAMVALLFFASVWTAFHAEMILSARRDDLREPSPAPGSDAEEQAAEAALVARESAKLGTIPAVPVLSSFVLTAWAALIGVWTIKRIDPTADWPVTGGLAVAAVLVSLVLAGHLRFLVDRPGTRQEKLGAGLAAQAGGLVAATIALGIGGWMQLCAWAAVGAAGVVAARWVRSRPLAWYGSGLLVVASARLLGFESLDPGLTGRGTDVFGLYLTRWALLAAVCAAAWSLAAIMLSGRGFADRLGGLRGLAVLASAASWMAVPVHVEAVGSSVGLAWLVMGIGGALASRRVVPALMLGVGASVVGVASTQLLVLAIWGFEPAAGVGVVGVMVTKWTGIAVAAAAAWVVVAWMASGRRTEAGVRGSALACVAATLGLALCVVNPESESAPVCVAWLGMGVMVAALQPMSGRLWPSRCASGLVLASLGAWGWAFVRRGDWGAHAWPLGLHPGLLIAGGIGVVLLGLAWWWKRYEPALAERMQVVATARWLAVALGFVATSHEAARAAKRLATDPTAQAATLTIWWALFATALLAVGFVRRIAAARWAGLSVLAMAVLKAVVYDMAGVALAWRVVVFMGLGAIMLSVAVVYARLQRGEASARANEGRSRAGEF